MVRSPLYSDGSAFLTDVEPFSLHQLSIPSVSTVPPGAGHQQTTWSGYGQRKPYSAGQGEGIKFGEEFDFETANAKFNKEDLEDQLREKLTLGEGQDGELEEGEVPEEGPITPGYDKSVSFFDNISTETRNPESKS